MLQISLFFFREVLKDNAVSATFGLFFVGVAPLLWLHLRRSWRVFRPISAQGYPRAKGPQNQQTKSGFLGEQNISLEYIGSHWISWISFFSREDDSIVGWCKSNFSLSNFATSRYTPRLMGCCNSREKTTVVDSSNVTLTRFHLGPLEVDADGVLLKLEWFGYIWMI